MKLRLFPTLLISLAMTVGTSLASRLNDPEASPAMTWGLGALIVAAAALMGGVWLAGARKEWRRMSVAHGACPGCGHDACAGGAPCPRCGHAMHTYLVCDEHCDCAPCELPGSQLLSARFR